MNLRLDIESLRALQVVSDQGGITRAADVLALSQSAVSHKIRRLEDSIDAPLLNRRTGAPLLTEQGEWLLSYARRIIDLHDEALSGLGRSTMMGRIRLGITEDTTSAGLSRVVGRFARRYSKVDIRSHVAQSLQLEAQLSAGDIDVAVIQIFSEAQHARDAILGMGSLAWVQSRDLVIDESLPLPFVAFDQDCFYRKWAIGEMRSRGSRFSLRTVLECPSITGVCNAVAEGFGIALINRRYMTSAMKIVAVDLPNPPPICYVVRTGARTRSAALDALVAEIVAEMGDSASRLT